MLLVSQSFKERHRVPQAIQRDLRLWRWSTGKHLKGPELVKQVSPAVALVKVKAGNRTINAFALDYQMKLESFNTT